LRPTGREAHLYTIYCNAESTLMEKPVLYTTFQKKETLTVSVSGKFYSLGEYKSALI